MYDSKAIENPFGISVYGSAILRIDPDLASIQFTVSRLKKHPKDAFSEVQAAVKKVSDFLRSSGHGDFGSSRITLESTRQFNQGENKFIGYTANAEFHLILRELERLESLLVGVVDAGANEIESVNYQTSKLKTIRAEARKMAVQSGMQKAQAYCDAAGVSLGQVIHITDVNPESLQERSSHGMKFREMAVDMEEGRPFNPGAIAVGGAVLMAFKIG